MEGASRVNDKVDSTAPAVEPKFQIQMLKATGDDEGTLALTTVASYFDVCESCDAYVRKQLGYILLTKKRGRKPKADKVKRMRKVKADAAPASGKAFPKPKTTADETPNGGADPDRAPLAE
jgi:hypothetical protein